MAINLRVRLNYHHLETTRHTLGVTRAHGATGTLDQPLHQSHGQCGLPHKRGNFATGFRRRYLIRQDAHNSAALQRFEQHHHAFAIGGRHGDIEFAAPRQYQLIHFGIIERLVHRRKISHARQIRRNHFPIAVMRRQHQHPLPFRKLCAEDFIALQRHNLALQPGPGMTPDSTGFHRRFRGFLQALARKAGLFNGR